MQIRKVEGLENLLQSLSMDEEPGKIHHVVYPWSEYSKIPGQDLGFWYSTDGCHYATLRRLISQEFARTGHPCGDRLADSLVLAFTLMPKTPDVLTEFERVLGSLVATDFSQFLFVPASALLRIVRPGRAPEHDLIGLFGHGPFGYEPLDSHLLEQIKSGVERIGLGSFLQDQEFSELLGCIAIYRQAQSTKVIDFNGLGFSGRLAPDAVNLIQYYFDDLSGALFEDFWRKHLESQYLFVAAGADLLDRTSLESLPGTAWLSVFWGFQLLSARGMVSFKKEKSHYKGELALQVQSFGRKLIEAKDRIRMELAEHSGLDPERVHPSLLSFGRLVTRARELQNRDYVEESFTLLMVALESLLLTKQDLKSSTLSRRAGALLAVSGDKRFEDSVKQVSKLYDARSRFVHEGEAIAPDLLTDLQEVCRTVFFAAYRGQARFTDPGKSGWKDKWVAVLDYIAACFDAGIIVDSDAAKSSGALKNQAGHSS